MTRTDNTRFLHKEIPNRKVHRVAAAFNTHCEYVVIYEVAIEHELNGFRATERPAFPKDVAEFTDTLIEFVFVSLVEEVLEASHCKSGRERAIGSESAEERQCWQLLLGVLNTVGHEIVAGVE
ncbi:hypothetical protein SAMN05444422_1067 [Halobiforma haloterrestris]|uniref:Uncharacterized protein n=1 Tax=Natronobacterium haloterrestre TaxID=148448 RepID=A0A1I1HIJ0_NATHA|nr:hypothetical protein SAMN05444422_1067 [Halobiforma haloterrestris]